MATEFIVTVNLTGEDYSSWTNAEAGLQTDLTAAATKVFAHGGITGSLSDNDSLTGKTSGATGTLVHTTATQILIESISGTFQSGEQIYETIDTNYVDTSDAGDSAIGVIESHSDDGDLDDNPTIAGATTDSSNYRKFTVHADDRHDGTENSGFRIHNTTVGSFGPTITNTEDNLIIEWCEGYQGGNNDQWFNSNASNVLAHKLLVYDCSETGILALGGDLTVKNCTIYDCVGTAIDYSATVTVDIYNCTLFRSNKGTNGFGAATVTVRNTAAMNNTTADFEDIDTQSYNISSDSTASGTGSQTLKTSYSDYFTNVGAGTEDFSVKDSSSVLYNAGTDLSGSGVTEDIIGTARPQAATYDVGAFELIAAVGANVPQKLHHYKMAGGL